jgi:hypothetical protein
MDEISQTAQNEKSQLQKSLYSEIPYTVQKSFVVLDQGRSYLESSGVRKGGTRGHPGVLVMPCSLIWIVVNVTQFTL